MKYAPLRPKGGVGVKIVVGVGGDGDGGSDGNGGGVGGVGDVCGASVCVFVLFFCCCLWWWWWRWWSTLITFSNHIVWFPSEIISYHDGHKLLPITPIATYHTAHTFGVLNDVANCQLPNGPLVKYVKLWVRMRRECRERFPCHRR